MCVLTDSSRFDEKLAIMKLLVKIFPVFSIPRDITFTFFITFQIFQLSVKLSHQVFVDPKQCNFPLIKKVVSFFIVNYK